MADSVTLHKSDSQMDAEAAMPRLEQPIESLIEDHRALYRADLMLPRLHVGTGYTTDHEAPASSPQSHIGWTGMEFSGSFLRLINWDRRNVQVSVRPTWPGQVAPWITARFSQWAECRRYHREHWERGEWRGSLCYQLVSFTVPREHPLEDACLVLGVTPARASRTLRQAFLFIEATMDRSRSRQEQRARPIRERILWRDGHERHGLGGMHRDDCPQCRVAI